MISFTKDYKYRFLYFLQPIEGCEEELKIKTTINYDNSVDLEFTSFNETTSCEFIKKRKYFFKSQTNSCLTKFYEDEESNILNVEINNCRLYEEHVNKNNSVLNIKHLSFIISQGREVLMYNNFDYGTNYTGGVTGIPEGWFIESGYFRYYSLINFPFEERAQQFGYEFDKNLLTPEHYNGIFYGSSMPMIDLRSSHAYYDYDDSISWFDYEFSGRMQIENLPWGFKEPVFGALTGITFYEDFNKEQYYILKQRNEEEFFIDTAIGMSNQLKCNENSIMNVNFKTGSWYRFKVKISNMNEGTSIQANIWNENNFEPIDWQINCVDSSTNRLISGTIGVWYGFKEACNAVRVWDDFIVIKNY